MEIKERDFKLSLNNNYNTWDLEVLTTSKDGKDKYISAGYGLTLEYAIRKISNYRISKNSKNLDMKSYLSRLKGIVDDLRTCIYSKGSK